MYIYSIIYNNIYIYIVKIDRLIGIINLMKKRCHGEMIANGLYSKKQHVSCRVKI